MPRKMQKIGVVTEQLQIPPHIAAHRSGQIRKQSAHNRPQPLPLPPRPANGEQQMPSTMIGQITAITIAVAKPLALIAAS